MPAGTSAEEIDLLRRSKKKTKRGLSEREDDLMEMEGDGTATPPNNGTGPVNEHFGQTSKTVNGQAISFKRALTGMKDKESFKIWNNSMYGVLENMDEENEEINQEEFAMTGRPDGPTGGALAGKGKRPQIQTTEAQILNDKSMNTRENTMGSQNAQKDREGNQSTLRNKNQTNRAAETECHTVVRGFNNGSRVETTTVNEEGSTTEVRHTQMDARDHHQDTPEFDKFTDCDDNGDTMMDVEFNEGRPSKDGGGAAM
nr:uncharacterized protein LOC109158743 [Ipomoea trifida]